MDPTEILLNLTAEKTIGYIGFILMIGHALPNMYITRAVMNDQEPSYLALKKLLMTSILVNIVSGTFILVYGILIRLQPIEFIVPSFIAVNLGCAFMLAGNAINIRRNLY
jgi:hypothetical protein